MKKTVLENRIAKTTEFINKNNLNELSENFAINYATTKTVYDIVSACNKINYPLYEVEGLPTKKSAIKYIKSIYQNEGKNSFSDTSNFESKINYICNSDASYSQILPYFLLNEFGVNSYLKQLYNCRDVLYSLDLPVTTEYYDQQISSFQKLINIHEETKPKGMFKPSKECEIMNNNLQEELAQYEDFIK